MLLLLLRWRWFPQSHSTRWQTSPHSQAPRLKVRGLIDSEGSWSLVCTGCHWNVSGPSPLFCFCCRRYLTGLGTWCLAFNLSSYTKFVIEINTFESERGPYWLNGPIRGLSRRTVLCSHSHTAIYSWSPAMSPGTRRDWAGTSTLSWTSITPASPWAEGNSPLCHLMCKTQHTEDNQFKLIWTAYYFLPFSF